MFFLLLFSSLLYLGCHLLREPITMQQLSSWIHLGRLPFFHIRLPDMLRDRVRKDPSLTTFFRPQSLPSSQRLLALTHFVATSVAAHMERVAQAATGDEMQHAGLTMQQARLLRELVVGIQTLPDDNSSLDLLASSVSTVNSSLLLRTWLDQLSLPAQLFPLAMELVSQLDLIQSRPRITKAGRPRKQPNVSGSNKVSNAQHQQITYMACLILAVQLTYGTTVADAAQNVDLAKQGDGDSDALPTFLSQVLQPTSTSISSSSPTPSASSPVSFPDSIAANWSIAQIDDWPKTIHGARTLPLASQSSFVNWMGEVVLSRLTAPKDFGFYQEQLGKVAKQQQQQQPPTRSGQIKIEERDASTSSLPQPSSSAAISSSSPSPSSSPLLSSVLACEHVITYAGNRRGAFHPLYAMLLHRCSRLLGISSSQLHTGVHRVIQMARQRHGKESVYINTQRMGMKMNQSLSSSLLPSQLSSNPSSPTSAPSSSLSSSPSSSPYPVRVTRSQLKKLEELSKTLAPGVDDDWKGEDISDDDNEDGNDYAMEAADEVVVNDGASVSDQASVASSTGSYRHPFPTFD